MRRQQEKRKEVCRVMKMETLNVGTMTGKGRELADIMQRRKVDVLCMQETRWKGNKARDIDNGCKLYYYGEDGRRNGVGIMLRKDLTKSVLEVRRVSDRAMGMKLEIGEMILNVLSAYAPQVGCELEEKERFWRDMDELLEGVPIEERVLLGADFNAHVGEGNQGDAEVMGKHGFGQRNDEGQKVVDFAKSGDMAVVNTYYMKKAEHSITHKSGRRNTQVDYILYRRDLKEVGDCKVVVGESVAQQHRMVVCKLSMKAVKKKREVVEPKVKWWKLKEVACQEEFREEVRKGLQGAAEFLEDWETTAGMLRKVGEKVLGVIRKMEKWKRDMVVE